MQTRPTGFSAVPPSGPEIPVVVPIPIPDPTPFLGLELEFQGVTLAESASVPGALSVTNPASLVVRPLP